jgi:hypothetical protein
VVDIATGYELDNPGFAVRFKNIFFSTSSRPALNAHLASYIMGTGVLYFGVKRPRRGAEHSPPISAEVKKICIYTSTPPYVFFN